jgi:hypothetical protein
MNQTKRQARLAGLLYFLASLPAPIGLVYVPSKLIALNDATATAKNIRASESLLRLGIASELWQATMFIFVALALYRLFNDRRQGVERRAGPRCEARPERQAHHKDGQQPQHSA